MKKIISFVLILVMLLAIAGCATPETTTQSPSPQQTTKPAEQTTKPAEQTTEPAKPKTVAFVMIGLNNDFFQALKGAYEKGFQAAGWVTKFTSGEFNPQTQITAVENYIAEGVDVIIIWAVAPGPLDAIAKQAMDAGIKVIAFVQRLADFDAGMFADDRLLALDEVYLASKWVDETFPDAAEGSVPAALLTMDSTEVVKIQGQTIIDNLSKHNPKIKLVKVFDVTAESVEAGVSAAENIYTTNPEIQLYLTVNASPALGVNNYFTGVSSPVKNYEKLGIFTVNGGTELHGPIKASGKNEAPLRGTVLTGGIDATIADFLEIAEGVMDGRYSNRYENPAVNVFVNADTIDEYLETGAVTSLSREDFIKD